MREFFRGWRRKVGCVALVMALVPFIVWTRSAVHDDLVRFDALGRRNLIRSERNGISWYAWTGKPIDLGIPEWGSKSLWATPTQWESGPRREQPDPPMKSDNPFRGVLSISNRYLPGFPHEDLTLALAFHEELQFRKWSCSYYLLIILPTLLSGCLILWKPRPKTNKAS